MRYLIVNADDFGQSRGVNAGVIEAHERGIVTSASLMVRWPAALEAVAYHRARPSLDLGIHLDLGEWTFRDGEWRPRYEVVPLSDPRRTAEEINRQISRFIELVGAPPTHIDSHQHVHLKSPVLQAALAVAKRLGVPLRHLTADVKYCGEFHGQDTEGMPLHELISPAALQRVLGRLGPGITELGCHPACHDDLDSSYRAERRMELRALCDESVLDLIQNEMIVLRSFAHLTLLSRAKG